MLIRFIYEDEELAGIKKQIKQLEVKQLYFLEEFIRKEKLQRKEKIFAQWQETLYKTIKHERNT